MSNTLESRNVPWQALQRRLADSFGSAQTSYPASREAQPHWRFTPTVGSWLSRVPSKVVRPECAAWATL